MVDSVPAFGDHSHLKQLILHLSSVSIIVMGSCSERIIADQYLFHDFDTYVQYKTYFIDRLCYNVFGIFVFFSILCTFLRGINHKYTKYYKCNCRNCIKFNLKCKINTISNMFVCIVLYLVLNGGVLYWDHIKLSSNDPVWYSDDFVFSWITHNGVCPDKWLRCGAEADNGDINYFTPSFWITAVGLTGLTPIIHILTLLSCQYIIDSKKKVRNHDLGMKKISYNSIDDSIRGGKHSNTKDVHVDDKNDYDNEILTMRIKILKYYLCFTIVWLFFLILCHFMIYAQRSKISQYWTTWILLWLTLTSTTKLVLKKIGRCIDCLRIRILILECETHINTPNNDDKLSCSFSDIKSDSTIKPLNEPRKQVELIMSVEWIVEILINVLYYAEYRIFIVADHLVDIEAPQFVLSVSLHLLSEICQTGVKSTPLYFDLSSRLQNLWQQKISQNKCVCLFHMFNDDSTLLQWQKRLSIDMMIRLTAGFSTFVWAMIWLAIGWKNYYGLKQKDLWKVIVYCNIGFIVDLLYFVLIMVIYKKWYNNDLTHSYGAVIKRYKKGFLFSWIASSLLINILN